MTTIATPPGGDPGRLPGNPFGFGPLMDWYDGNGPSGPGGNCSECEQTPWVPPGTPSSAPAEGGNAQGGNTETAGTRFTSAPSPGRGSATSAMYRAAALYGTARQVGVILPRITTSEGCTGCGPCNGWVNLEGNLSIQMGPPGTGHPFDPPVCFTDNSAAPFTPNQFGGWQNSFDPGVFDNLDGTVKLTTPNGTTVVYTGNPTGGNYYTTPEGVQSRLKLLSGGTGWEEVQFNGLKRTYDDTGRLTKYQSDAGTWTVTRDGTKVSSIEGPTGKRTTYSYDVNGKLEKITDSGGRETLFGFTGDLLTKITSPEQCVTSFTDESVTNRLETWTTPAGVNLTFSYDASNRLTKIEGPGTAVTTYSHDTSTMAITDAQRGGKGNQPHVHHGPPAAGDGQESARQGLDHGLFRRFEDRRH